MMGRMLIENAHDVKLLGRGIIDPSVKMGIRIANSRNVQVEGLVATQCATGGSDSVTIRNVKVISYFGWGDGMNVFSSKNVLFDRVFVGIRMIVLRFTELVSGLRARVQILPCRTPRCGRMWLILFYRDSWKCGEARDSGEPELCEY